MKFVHIADMHFDSPFVNLSDKDIMGDARRLEQRKAFKKIIEYIKENDIEMMFISGDLYEQKYIKKSTIEYINNLFKEIPKTKVFIAPGNHDPYIKNSYYNQYNWNENVKIFNSKMEKVQCDNINIYGYGFDDFYCTNCGIENLELNEKDKINILVIHGSIDGANIEDKQYNSMSKKNLENKQFDYIALGHIHKKEYNSNNNQRIVYPGSTISLGFDELGEHGMILGNISKEEIKLEFIPIDETEFKEIEIDITEINFKEELIEKINELKINRNEFIKIIFTGKRNFEINTNEILKLILNDKIIKLKDETKIKYNLKELSNENTLKGLFSKAILERLNDDNLTKEDIEILEKALEIGFDALT